MDKQTLTAAWRFFYDWLYRPGKLAVLLVRAYAFNLAVALDILVNAIAGGDPGETVSSRLGKGDLKGQPVHTALSFVVDLLFLVLFGQIDHCHKAIQHDEGWGAISNVIDRYRRGEKQLWRV